MKIKELTSIISNELRSIGLDDRISNRFMYSKYLNYESLFIKRESDSRRIFNNTNLFHTINCVEMKEISSVECSNIYIPNVKTYSKSVLPIPQTHTSIYGDMLYVFNLDESVEFKSITPSNYVNIMNREFKSKIQYYWIDGDNYLIIPNTVEKVKLKLLIKGDVKSGINAELTTPSWMIGDILKYVIQDIRNSKSIPMDENPNMNNNLK